MRGRDGEGSRGLTLRRVPVDEGSAAFWFWGSLMMRATSSRSLDWDTVDDWWRWLV